MTQLPGFTVPDMEPEDRRAALESLTKDASSRLTICEQLRFVYDTVYLLPDGEIRQDLTNKLVVAFGMGKKMNSRLAHYKRKYEDESGRTGKSLLHLGHTEERKRMREVRK